MLLLRDYRQSLLAMSKICGDSTSFELDKTLNSIHVQIISLVNWDSEADQIEDGCGALRHPAGGEYDSPTHGPKDEEGEEGTLEKEWGPKTAAPEKKERGAEEAPDQLRRRRIRERKEGEADMRTETERLKQIRKPTQKGTK